MNEKENYQVTEQILIALAITNIEYLIEIQTNLVVEDFQNETNRKVYQTLLKMKNNDENIDPVSLCNNLVKEQIFENFDSANKYIDQVSNNVPFTTIDLRTYINQIKDHILKEKLNVLVKETYKELTSKPIDDINDFLGKFEKNVQELAQKRRVSSFLNMDTIVPALMESMYERIKQRRHDKNFVPYLTGLSTGYQKLDYITAGFRPGEMIIIAARPSVGKTAFVLNLIYNVSKSYPVAFFSLEMSDKQIAKRLLQKVSGLSTEELDTLDYDYNSETKRIYVSESTAKSSSQQLATLQASCENLSSKNIFIDDSSSLKMFDIEQKAKKLKQKYPNLAMIAIDYLGLIQVVSKNSTENRTQQIGELSRQLKALARDLNIPIVVLSQMSRDSEKRTNHEPTMSDLRDSGNIEQDADIIMTLFRSDYYNNTKKSDQETQTNQETENSNISNVTVNVLKNRNGKTGKVYFCFSKNTCEFSAITEGIDDENN